MIAALNGTLLLIIAAMMLLSSAVALYYRESPAAMLLAAGLTAAVGWGLYLFNFRNLNRELGKRDGFVIVGSGWFLMAIFGALPYLLSGHIPALEDAFFESFSGFSTTGSTILSDIEALPKVMLFWRSMTHWIGGMGIIVLTVAILPLLGIGGMQLFAAESSGVRPDKLHPRITSTAKRLWVIYVALTAAESILLKSAGMTWFDAVNHSMSTLATGGFSTKNASIAHYDSAAIHWIIILFMFLGGVSFTGLYLAFTGRFERFFRNEELKVYFFNVLIFGGIIGFTLWLFSGVVPEAAFRIAFFQTVSIMTTTGFITDNYLLWPNFLIFIIFALFFSGASTGSTSGGIKLMRHIILIRNSFMEFKRQLHPNAILPVRFNGRAVPQPITNTVSGFVLTWLLVFFLSVFIMSMFGLDFLTAIGSVTSSLGNIGPGIGSVGPVDNFAHMPVGAKYFLSFLMLLGRLELYTILMLLMPYFWQRR